MDAHHAWQTERRQLLGVFISQSNPSYGWPTNDGSIWCAAEPGWMVPGGISVLEHVDLSDVRAREIILDLAEFLAERLGQLRVYVSFMGEDLIIEAPHQRTR